MALRPVDARVLACLIEKETTVPDSYPLTLNALRSACNQSSNRNPVTDYDDRTIDDALVALKSIGLVRFVHPSHGGRNIRYRHVADERWDLGVGELGVLALLILRGPETMATLRARADKHLSEADTTVEDALDTLMARRPDPFVMRAEPRRGEREARYVHLLCGEPDMVSTQSERGTDARVPNDLGADESTPDHEADHTVPTARSGEASRMTQGDVDLEALVELLAGEVADLRARVERLEAGDA